MSSKTASMTGPAQIEATFSQAKEQGRAVLMPYFTLGYPQIDASLDIIAAVAEYSDLLELGIPFSDPLADGPTVQHSSQVALENGITVRACLEKTAELRRRGVSTPASFMSYYNPILAYGLEQFVADARAAGVQGLIIPDLPPEEAEEIARLCHEAGLAYIYFLAPTSNDARIKQVTQRAAGFIYLVSVTGVTGARARIHDDLAAFIGRVRAQTTTPLAVGFGISTPQQAASVGQ